MSFDVPEDPESVELKKILATMTPAEATTRITGLQPGELLFDDVVAIVERKVGAAATAG